MAEICSEGDAVLLRRWVGGDAIAGNELVRRHYGVVRAFIEKTSSEPADDLVQQTFLACMEHG
ncbi:MAG: RNA polymerase sigma factor, partial [Polyangiaceae bacterium]